MVDTQTDVFCAAESNTNWTKTTSLTDRTIGLFESRRVSTAYLSAFPFPSVYQPGGVFILARDQMAYRSFKLEQDQRVLGRWTSMTFRGLEGIILRVVTAYRPVKTLGATTAYGQQALGLNLVGITTCPREQMLLDLKDQLGRWIDAGERIVLAIDFNGDIRGEECVAYFHSVGLREVLSARHGIGPPTYHHSEGHAVDGIFCTPEMGQHIRGGYFELGAGVYKADHRCLWIDIPLGAAFGSSLPKFIRPEARRLRCHDPQSVDRYNTIVYQAYSSNPIFVDTVQLFDQLHPDQLSPPLIRQYNRFNSWRSLVLLKAEHKCRRLHMGGVPYSPPVTAAMKTITLWKHVLSRVKGRKYSLRYQARLEKATGVRVPPIGSLTEEIVTVRIAEAYASYILIKKEAGTRRITFLESLAVAQTPEGGSSEGILKSMVDRERARAISRRIRASLTNGFNNCGLDYVVGLDNVPCYDQAGMCHLLAAENSQRFIQSQDTPFMVSPELIHDFGRVGVGVATDAVLDGLYQIPPNCSRGARLFLQHVKRPVEIDPIPPRITTASYRQAFKAAQEKTSSSHSGIHYGHYKALFSHLDIASVEAAWMNAPFALGFASKRSQEGVDIMLEKKQGVRMVSKLRAILLFEADYNTHAKILSRQLMSAAERWLAPEQFGSRNRHSAIEQALNKRLMFDHIRVHHIPTAWVFTDCKSCYDRIVHTPASLALQRMGLSKEAATSIFSTIADMRHYVRTGLGDSKTFYTNGVIPFQGVGQGSGLGPCIWALLSSVLFDAMRGSGFGASVKAPISGSSLELMGGAFVDDLDLFSMRDPTLFGYADIEEMQRGLDLWEELLRATGGAVEPTKSEWYCIDFSWKNGVASLRTQDPSDVTLTCLDHHQVRSQLSLKQVDQGSKTLGVWLAPDGKSKDATRELRMMAELCADQLRTLRIPPKDIWQALHARFLKRIHYPLLAMTLTEKECAYIMTPFLEAMLSAMGVCKKLPRAIVYGPTCKQGLGIPHLYTIQGLKHLEFILGQPNNVSRHLIHTAVENTLIEAGCSSPLFSQPFCKYVTKTWVSSTWEFTRVHLDLEVDDGRKGLQLLCDNDCFLMTAIASSGQFTTAQLGHINRCRLYLRVYSLADITQGNGSHLAKWAWSGDYTQRMRPQRASWPYQERPGTTSWTLWRRALRLCFAASLTAPLIESLGNWISRDHWWFYSPSDDKLYSHGFRYSRGTNNRFRYRVPVLEDGIPADIQPATVFRHGVGIFVLEGYRPYNQVAPEPIGLTLREFIDTSPSSLKWAIADSIGLEHSAAIITAIINGTCSVVSDGSFQAKFSTAAFTITSESNPFSNIDGVCVVPGCEQSAYRAELGGIYAGLAMLMTLVNRSLIPITSGVVTFGCDGQSALNRIAKARREAKGTHFDLVTGILACRHSLEERGVTIRFQHVKGHQDAIGGHSLSFLEELNVKVDRDAQQHNAACRLRGLVAADGDVHGEIGPIWISIADQGRFKIYQDVVRQVHDLHHGSILLKYWTEHGNAVSPDVSDVDWEVLARATSSRSVAQHIFDVKRVSGYLGVGKWMFRWRKRQSASCLLCGAPEEDISHVYRCPDPGIHLLWCTETSKLSQWVVDTTQSYRLSDFLKLLLMAYRENGPPVEPLGLPEVLQTLWREQWELGQDAMLNGFLSSRWREIVEGNTGRVSAMTWTRRLVIQIYEMCGKVWGRRNELMRQEDGGSFTLARTEVTVEVMRGPEGNARVEELMVDGARPTDASNLHYIQFWLASVQVARVATLPQEDRNRSGRQIMARWLQSGRVGQR